MRRLHRVTAVAVAALALPSLAACTSGSHSATTRASGAGSTQSAAGATATRWWSDAAGSAGSTVSASDPTAAARKLTVSRPTYCSMLAATVNGGHSLFPNATPHDSAMIAGTTAFVTELSKVAPPSISSSWAVLSPVIVSLVKSGGSFGALRANIDEAAVSKAAAAVAADAKTNCDVTLSS